MVKENKKCCTFAFFLLLLLQNLDMAMQLETITVGNRTLKVYQHDSNLPSGMIALHATKGQELLAQTMIVNQNLIDRFTDQVNLSYCGLASLANVMNSWNLGYHIKYQSVTRISEEEKALEKAMGEGLVRVTEDEIVNAPGVKKCYNTEKIIGNGLTLSELNLIVGCSGLGSVSYYALPDNVKGNEEKQKELTNSHQQLFRSVKEFRTFTRDHVSRALQGVIVNYNLGELGYEGLKGHFSPLAAYHEESDMVLVMDVWPYTPSVWVSTDLLFKAMCGIDDDSKLPRGLLHVYELLV